MGLQVVQHLFQDAMIDISVPQGVFEWLHMKDHVLKGTLMDFHQSKRLETRLSQNAKSQTGVKWLLWYNVYYMKGRSVLYPWLFP